MFKDTFSEMTVLEEPSKRRRPIGGIETQVRLLVVQRTGSIKQSGEPESIRDRNSVGMCEEVNIGHRELDFIRAEALSRKGGLAAQSSNVSRPLGHAESRESLLSFPIGK
jgi:hypothetical protein